MIEQLLLIREISEQVHNLCQSPEADMEKRRIDFGVWLITLLSEARLSPDTMCWITTQSRDVFVKRARYWDCSVHGQNWKATTPCCFRAKGY